MRFDQSHKWYILVLFPPRDSRPATRYQVWATKKDAMAKGQTAHQNGSTGDKYGTFFFFFKTVGVRTETHRVGGTIETEMQRLILTNPKRRSEEQIANRGFWG